MSGNLFFGRTWQVTTYRNNVPILSYSSNDIDPNRIIFDCAPYNGIGQASQLTLSIYNISSQDKENILINDVIEVRAGYIQRGTGTIFYGQIQSFYGAIVADSGDFNYVFTIYGSAYFGGNQDTLSPQLDAVSLDLSQNNLGVPSTIGNQAAYIANYYSYKPGTAIQQSYANTPSTNIVVNGSTMDELLADFFHQTGAALIFDSRDMTYSLLPAIPNNTTFPELSTGKPIVSILDNNNGLVGFPTYDVVTGFVKCISLIDTQVEFMSFIQVDLSNSQVTSISKSLNQEILVSYRDYSYFLVSFISYSGDTRGDIAWYQTLLLVGQK